MTWAEDDIVTGVKAHKVKGAAKEEVTVGSTNTGASCLISSIRGRVHSVGASRSTIAAYFNKYGYSKGSLSQ